MRKMQVKGEKWVGEEGLSEEWDQGDRGEKRVGKNSTRSNTENC